MPRAIKPYLLNYHLPKWVKDALEEPNPEWTSQHCGPWLVWRMVDTDSETGTETELGRYAAYILAKS